MVVALQTRSHSPAVMLWDKEKGQTWSLVPLALAEDQDTNSSNNTVLEEFRNGHDLPLPIWASPVRLVLYSMDM